MQISSFDQKSRRMIFLRAFLSYIGLDKQKYINE